jgi:hypothetical protein
LALQIKILCAAEAFKTVLAKLLADSKAQLLFLDSISTLLFLKLQQEQIIFPPFMG